VIFNANAAGYPGVPNGTVFRESVLIWGKKWGKKPHRSQPIST
jgi:hypothetical protein